MTKRLSVTVPDGLAALVEGLSTESYRCEDVPDLSQARVIRLLAGTGADQLVDGEIDLDAADLDADVTPEVLRSLVPTHELARFLYEEEKDSNWHVDMKRGFRERVRNRLETRFKNGYTPEGAREVAESYEREARIFFKLVGDDPAGYEREVAWLADRLDEYAEKHQTTTWDPDEKWLDNLTGVEEGYEQEAVAESAIEIVEDLADRIERVGSTANRDDVVRAVAKKYGVEEARVWDLIRAVQGPDDQLTFEDSDTPALAEVVSGDD